MDNGKSCYLILHVLGSLNQDWNDVSAGREIERLARKRGLRLVSPRRMYREAVREIRKLGITLMHLPVREGEPGSKQHWRFFFRFPRFVRRDEEAEQFGESFIYSMELLHGPVLNPDHPTFVFRVPAAITRKEMSFAMIAAVDEARPPDEQTLPWPARDLPMALGTSEHTVAAAWRATPVVFQNECIRRALMFLSQSYQHFYVFPGQVREVLGDPKRTAPNTRIQAAWENALHNAFKAVEAVIGDPSKDDRKLANKLSEIGMDASERIDLREAKTTLQILREMSWLRDKKAAHGSTPIRALWVGDVLRFQTFSSIVIEHAIERRLGRPICETGPTIASTIPLTAARTRPSASGQA